MENRKKNNRNRERRIERKSQRKAVELSKIHNSMKVRVVSRSLPYELLIKSGCM